MCICTYQIIRISGHQITRGKDFNVAKTKEMEILSSIHGGHFF
jgi:hypothetical protein